MELREALSQISEIRQQMARSEIFQGYRSVSVAITGGLGIAAACLQPVFIPSPSQQIDRYLALWIGIAVTVDTVPRSVSMLAETFRNNRPSRSGIIRTCWDWGFALSVAAMDTLGGCASGNCIAEVSLTR